MKNYLQILQDSLEQKLKTLERLEEKSREQSQLIRGGGALLEKIDRNMDEKAAMIRELEVLDRGFDSLYNKIRAELIANQDKYKEEIGRLQELITRVTEKSATIQAVEARNKTEVEIFFSRQRKELKGKRDAMSITRDYYRNMNKIKHVSPQFLDRKR